MDTSTEPSTDPTPPRTKRGRVLAWALWDWGASAYSTIVVTFVIAPYLTEDVAAQAPTGSLSGATWLSIALAAAGLLIALLAPVIGQRADAGGRRKLNLALWSGLTVISAAGLFFVRDEYSYLWLGLILMAAGSVFSEFAGVSYNAMLRQVSTPATIGKVSGFGWAAGYVGGIGVLLGAYLLFIQPEVGLFGVTADGGLKFRVLAVVAAVWFAVWSIPVLIAVPEIPPTDRAARVGFFASYGVLIKQLRGLYAGARHTVWFLLASAIFRDGLAAVFAFGAVLARSVYGLSAGEVIIFGVAANVVAAAGAFAAGFIEDRVGPKLIILVSLGGLIVAAVVLLFAQGSTMFWIFGLALCLWVGPAQSSSRTFLARLSPAGHEGQLFGLYATTGRAVSFLAPSLFGLFAGIFASDRMGIIGIALVLLVGAIALLGVRPPPREAPVTP
ncbi:MFS transporter [Microlunatus speluncae]|uniref:MFS transporter n=1 Tax=Microlunatus speluncae TaxID=2594267 RepID=UPI0012667028|nr:MFS transporter [Microlunatus speluncae]